MAAFIDRVGMTYGQLTVVSLHTRKPESKWLCRCSCGKEKTVLGGNLTSGDTRSCGCLHAAQMRETRSVDLTGKMFGSWKVVSRCQRSTKPGDDRWLCECTCESGTRKEISRGNLTSGRTKSCGCEMRNLLSKRRMDLTGAISGFLEYLKDVDGVFNPRRLVCLCRACGKEHETAFSVFIAGNVKSCGCMRAQLGGFTFKPTVDISKLAEGDYHCNTCNKDKPREEFCTCKGKIIPRCRTCDRAKSKKTHAARKLLKREPRPADEKTEAEHEIDHNYGINL